MLEMASLYAQAHYMHYMRGLTMCITFYPTGVSEISVHSAIHCTDTCATVPGWDMNTRRICPAFYGTACIVASTSWYVEN